MNQLRLRGQAIGSYQPTMSGQRYDVTGKPMQIFDSEGKPMADPGVDRWGKPIRVKTGPRVKARTHPGFKPKSRAGRIGAILKIMGNEFAAMARRNPGKFIASEIGASAAGGAGYQALTDMGVDPTVATAVSLPLMTLNVLHLLHALVL